MRSSRWDVATQTEQIGSFLLASTMVTVEMYLAFRGLVIGVPGIAWSKSGLRQIHRGLILGPNGAIAHFERSWDVEDQWINSMSFAALVLIHRHLGNLDDEGKNLVELEKLGGWESVDSSWIKAVEDGPYSSRERRPRWKLGQRLGRGSRRGPVRQANNPSPRP